MGDTNPANLLGFVILGAALLWSVRVVYGARRRTTDDMVKRTLLMGGWVLVFGGGRILEDGEPKPLEQKSDSAFARLCAEEAALGQRLFVDSGWRAIQVPGPGRE